MGQLESALAASTGNSFQGSIKMIAEEIDRKNIDEELEKIGVDRAAFDIFHWKSRLILLKLYDVNAKGANILKQEFLANGGDVAVHRDVASWKTEKTDCLLIGTEKVFKRVYDKLHFEPFFGLTEVRAAIEKELNKNTAVKWEINGKQFEFGSKHYIMGILNTTPDSFSDGGKFNQLESALKHVEEMLNEGADIIDVGGESTRPGAEKVPEETEIQRTAPIIKEIRNRFPKAIISIDTYKAKVAKEAIKNGANIINDISGLRFDKDMKHVAMEYDVPVVVMHIKGTPKDMQKNPYYENVIKELLEYFEERINSLESSGISKIIIDPGIGFGKRIEDNLRIIDRLNAFKIFGKPVLLGASRKSFIGKTLNKTVENRLFGTLAADMYGIFRGADIIRVHDVAPHKDLITMLEAIRNA
jgi:dihydropteroate synthase